MRLLVLNHFFGQDIQSLASCSYPDLEIRIVEYEALRGPAMRVLPRRATDGLGALDDQLYATERRVWEAYLRGLVRSAYRRWPFDAFISPSDTFFYVRDVPAICHEIGVPFVVIQKETTISSATMDRHSQALRRAAPPIADWMTCCSERNKEFWERCGHSSDIIEVTGQPRFDFYRHPDRWPERMAASPPTVLFLSYEPSAYHPTEGVLGAGRPWALLHRQTEDALWELARRGWKVRIKPHPQQQLDADWQRLKQAASALPSGSVELLAGDADTREVIVTSDVVVGFQSTALIEALSVGRPVIYTGWDREAQLLSNELIPFPEWEGPVRVVRDERALPATIEHALEATLDSNQQQMANRIIDTFLGPIDGESSERALSSISKYIERHAVYCGEQAISRRGQLLKESFTRHMRASDIKRFTTGWRSSVPGCKRLI